MSETTEPIEQKATDFLSRPLQTVLSLDWEKGIYILFILAAIVSRFWGLGARVMSHDESLHTQFSYQYYNGDGFEHTPLMHGPFLFHITALSYWLFGDGDTAARIPVALFGVLLVAMPYLFRRYIGRVGALFGSFIFLISPYLTYYSRYIRHDIYIIVWALIVFAAIWNYISERDEKHLWWFAAGTALMFSTKEVAFIYVAIFGSWLVVRLLSQISRSSWFPKLLPQLRQSILVTLFGVLLIGGGYLGQAIAEGSVQTVASTEFIDGVEVAKDAERLAAEQTAADEAAAQAASPMRWLQIAGIAVLSAGLFLAAREMRPHVDDHPEFDLIVLFSTLLLPMVSPLLTTIAGWNPRDYTLNHCVLDGQEAMSSIQLLLARAGNGICWSSFLSSGVVRSGIFLIISLIAGVLVGLWWNRRRWLIAAAIFHTIFIVLYTSVFTNPSGWTSGMVGSLGYWLEQQAVERGSQPWYYYFFVTPLYEFLPLIFSIAAARLWMAKEKINRVVGYWLTLLLSSLLVFSLSNWLINRSAVSAGESTSSTAAAVASGLLFGLGIIYWIVRRRGQLAAHYQLSGGLMTLFNRDSLVGFVPSVLWWLILSAAAYSYAGEKMPWLSTHFVIPMALLVGYYFNEKLEGGKLLAALVKPLPLRLMGLTALLIAAAALAAGPLLLGKIQFGSQELDNLTGIGRFLGSSVIALAIFYLWRQTAQKSDSPVRRPAVILAVFALLALMTIRFSYMASFPNADSASEFLVYAHGAPATKNVVMKQVEELSKRLHGDKSIKVAFSQDTSWPFTWYLRDYPNRVFYGDNPSHSLTESPIILVGSLDWAKTEPYLGDDYYQRTYTYLWWPMEEYRKFSWNAIFGNPNNEDPRGLGSPAVRQALWDIFFYRDYEKYGKLFNSTYTAGQWPLRHEMRLYIRKDVLADLWDYGLGAVSSLADSDPYADKEFEAAPVMSWTTAGDTPLLAPRNVSVAPDGTLFVADSGNHRIVVYNADGSFRLAFGQAGADPGGLNEPWGLLATEDFVYVADTWNHRLQQFTHEGELVKVLGVSGSPADDSIDSRGMFFGPRDIVQLANGDFLVTDTGNHRMQIFDQNGEFTRLVGSFGNLLGQVNEPVGLGVGPDGSVYLADTWNGRIQRFSSDLFALSEWPVDAWEGSSTNNKPYLAVDSGGRVYVTDPEGYRVLIFSGDGEFLGRFGGFGTETNRFSLPNGIAIDSQDNIYISDAGNSRVVKFAPIFPPAEPLPAEDDSGGQESSPVDVSPSAGEAEEGESPSELPTEGGEAQASPTAGDVIIEPTAADSSGSDN